MLASQPLEYHQDILKLIIIIELSKRGVPRIAVSAAIPSVNSVSQIQILSNLCLEFFRKIRVHSIEDCLPQSLLDEWSQMLHLLMILNLNWSTSLSLSLFLSLSFSLSFSLSLSLSLSLFLFLYLSIDRPIYLSIYLSIYIVIFFSLT